MAYVMISTIKKIVNMMEEIAVEEIMSINIALIAAAWVIQGQPYVSTLFKIDQGPQLIKLFQLTSIEFFLL